MYVKDFKKYVDGIDICRVQPDQLTYPSQNSLIYKGVVYKRPGITNDGTPSTSDDGVIGETVWKDQLSGRKAVRCIKNFWQTKVRGNWITIYDGTDVRAIRVRFATWLDSTTPIIKKRLYAVDGSTAIHEWNGAMATVASVAANTITIDGDKTLQQLGFDNGTHTETATTISFTAANKTISDSGSGFVAAGFAVGQKITVSGSIANDGTYTIAVVSPGAIIVEETLTDEAAGASITISAALTIIIVRYTGDAYAGQEEYTYSNDASSNTIVINGAISPTVNAGDIIIAKPFVHTDKLDTVSKDDLFTYQNHLTIGTLESPVMYLSSIETPLDYVQPSAGSRTALSPIIVYLDANFTAMGSRKNVLWVSTADDFFKLTKTVEVNAYGLWIDVEKFEQPERNGALPFAMASYKSDLIFMSQDHQLQRITTVELTGKDDTMLLSDDVSGLLERTDLNEMRLYYGSRYVYITAPAASKLFMLDMIGNPEMGLGSFWQPPQTIPISLMSVIDGVRYGHSNVRDETFVLFDGGSDLGSDIVTLIASGYVGGEDRYQMNKHTRIGIDGRISLNTTATARQYWETDGAKNYQETILDGANMTLFNLPTDFSWGMLPWTAGSWTGDPNPSEDGDVPEFPIKRFYAFDSTLATSWFEYRVVFEVTGQDQYFHLLGWGLDQIPSDRKIDEALFIKKS